MTRYDKIIRREKVMVSGFLRFKNNDGAGSTRWKLTNLFEMRMVLYGSVQILVKYFVFARNG